MSKVGHKTLLENTFVSTLEFPKKSDSKLILILDDSYLLNRNSSGSFQFGKNEEVGIFYLSEISHSLMKLHKYIDRKGTGVSERHVDLTDAFNKYSVVKSLKTHFTVKVERVIYTDGDADLIVFPFITQMTNSKRESSNQKLTFIILTHDVDFYTLGSRAPKGLDVYIGDGVLRLAHIDTVRAKVASLGMTTVSNAELYPFMHEDEKQCGRMYETILETLNNAIVTKEGKAYFLCLFKEGPSFSKALEYANAVSGGAGIDVVERENYQVSITTLVNVKPPRTHFLSNYYSDLAAKWPDTEPLRLDKMNELYLRTFGVKFTDDFAKKLIISNDRTSVVIQGVNFYIPRFAGLSSKEQTPSELFSSLGLVTPGACCSDDVFLTIADSLTDETQRDVLKCLLLNKEVNFRLSNLLTLLPAYSDDVIAEAFLSKLRPALVEIIMKVRKSVTLDKQ